MHLKSLVWADAYFKERRRIYQFIMFGLITQLKGPDRLTFAFVLCTKLFITMQRMCKTLNELHIPDIK